MTKSLLKRQHEILLETMQPVTFQSVRTNELFIAVLDKDADARLTVDGKKHQIFVKMCCKHPDGRNACWKDDLTVGCRFKAKTLVLLLVERRRNSP